MYAILVVFARFVCAGMAVRAKDCSTTLEMTVFRPRMCLTEYFKSMTCDFNKRAQYYLSNDPLQAATYCLRFSEGNQVGLSILDSQGINMHILNNPTAYKMSEISRELDLRSADNRYAIYEYFNPNIFGIPALTPPGDENVDLVGLLYIYQNITTTLGPVKDLTAIPYIDTVLEYIRSYPVSGPQYIADLQYNALFASITASVPTSQANTKLARLMNDFAAADSITIEFNNFGSASYNTVIFLLILLCAAAGNLINPVFINFLNARLVRYQRIITILLEGTGTASIQESFAQTLPINTLNDGICYFAYNLHLPFGKLARIVFSQTNLGK